MKAVYQQNTQLGDPLAIEGQLSECKNRLGKFHHELDRYQSYLVEMDSPNYQHPTTYGTHQNGSRQSQNRGSGSDESLSRSASDLSQTNQKPSAPSTPLPSHGYALFYAMRSLLSD